MGRGEDLMEGGCEGGFAGGGGAGEGEEDRWLGGRGGCGLGSFGVVERRLRGCGVRVSGGGHGWQRGEWTRLWFEVWKVQWKEKTFEMEGLLGDT